MVSKSRIPKSGVLDLAEVVKVDALAQVDYTYGIFLASVAQNRGTTVNRVLTDMADAYTIQVLGDLVQWHDAQHDAAPSLYLTTALPFMRFSIETVLMDGV